MEKKYIIFIDGGDTLIEEGSLNRGSNDIIISADAVPGALETLRDLKNEGYIICLIDDVPAQSAINVFTENGHFDCFSSISTPDDCGTGKPLPGIFADAMSKNGLTEDDKKRIIMIGNSCRSDIAGANRFGIISVLMDWSPRYSMTPQNADEVPDFIIHEPSQIPELLKRLEKRNYEKTVRVVNGL